MFRQMTFLSFHIFHKFICMVFFAAFFSSLRREGFFYVSHHEEHETRDVAIPFLMVNIIDLRIQQIS